MDRNTHTNKGHLTTIYAIARALCRFAVEHEIDGPYEEWQNIERGHDKKTGSIGAA